MIKLLLGILAFCWVDLSNPVGITTLILLISLVKERWHSLLYIISMYVGYYICSLLLFVGAYRYLEGIIRHITHHPMFFTLKMILGVISFIGAVILLYYAIKVIRKKKTINQSSNIRFISVNPIILVGIAFYQSVADLPGCFPLFSYLAFLTSNHASFFEAAICLAIFCIFSTIPMFLIYFISIKYQGAVLERIIAKIKYFFNCFFLVILSALLFFVSGWCFWDKIIGMGR